MSFYYQSGEGLNNIERARASNISTAGAITVSPAADAYFPVSNICNGHPSEYFKYGSVGVTPHVQVDLNIVPGGDGENLSTLTGWTATSGSIITSSAQNYGTGGAASLRVYNATAPAAHCDVRMRAGESFRIYYAARGATGTSSIRFTNIDTNLDLVAGPAWGAGTLVSTAAAAWSSGYLTYTMPTMESGAPMWQRCRVQLAVTGAAGDGYFEVKIVPGWDLIVVLGHSASFGSRPAFMYQALSTNDPYDGWSSGSYVPVWFKTTDSTPYPFVSAELSRPALWNRMSTMRYERWIRYSTHESQLPPSCTIGELILTQAETLPVNPRLGLSSEHSSPGQVRYETGAGDVWTFNKTPNPSEKLRLGYVTKSPPLTGVDTSARAAWNLHVARTHSGRWPTLVIPYEHDPAKVVYGHLVNQMTTAHIPPLRTFEVEIQSMPIPGLHHGL